jgi:predicted Zn-ribbon and HTH transcriptional regulator
VIPTAILFRRDRRRFPPSHCQRCGYDLTGNMSGVCPECGLAVSPSDPKG